VILQLQENGRFRVGVALIEAMKDRSRQEQHNRSCDEDRR
jgi:hypothetical protein